MNRYKLYFNFGDIRKEVFVDKQEFFDVIQDLMNKVKVEVVRKSYFTFYYLGENYGDFNPDEVILIGAHSNTIFH